jgi:DNA-3-methyladenine glycosylase I
MLAYHDEEWGTPLHDDRLLFEFLILEGAQAGLSWRTILNKRENYRRAFDRFDAKKIARYDARKKQQLLADPGIVRNRLKVESTIDNARAFLDVQDEFDSFDAYIWRFVEGKPIRNEWRALKEIPARTSASDAMSKDLKKRGFRFVGSTICYAFMQATGMVNDHMVDCFRYRAVGTAMTNTRWRGPVASPPRGATAGAPLRDPPRFESRTASTRWGVCTGAWSPSSLFSLAGTVLIGRPIVDAILPEDTPTWAWWTVKVVVIVPIYEVLLVSIGTLLGQGRFFRDKQRRVLRALSRLFRKR